MRTCTYSNGDIISTPGDCPDNYYDATGNLVTLTDWSDAIDVTTAPPGSIFVGLLVAGIALMLFFGER